MSESFKGFFAQQEGTREGIESREKAKELFGKVTRFQLEYAKHIMDTEGLSAFDAVCRYTISADIFNHHEVVENLINTPDDSHYYKQLFLELEKINRSLEPEKWASEAYSIILNIGKTINKLEAEEEEDPSPSTRVGNFDVNLVTIDVQNVDANYGLPNGTRCLELHFQQKIVLGKGFVNPKNSLKKIAEYLKQNLPDVEYIIGSSWLMDTEIAKRLGFEVVKRFKGDPDSEFVYEDAFNEPGYWGQALNDKGDIDPSVRECLYTRGVLPYDFAYGVMKREYLMEKYLEQSVGSKE